MLNLCTVLSQCRHRQAAKCIAAAQMTMTEIHGPQSSSFHGKLARRIPVLLRPPLPLNVCTERLRSAITTLKNTDNSASIISPSP